MTTPYRTLDRCLACGSVVLEQYLDLGDQPLANTYHVGAEDPLPRYPLGLNLCLRCCHSQLTVAVEPDLLFKDYPYVSGTSDSLRAYFRDFVDRVAGTGHLRVLDIGSNDGSLLREFMLRGHLVRGVDPAENLAPDDIQTVAGYWGAEAAKQLCAFGPDHYDVVVAMNVLGHNADPLAFLKTCRHVLAPGGKIYIQTSQARMVERSEFDTVYHEHHSFFNASSFCALAARAGFDIKSIEHVPVHGTSHLVQLWLPDGKFKNPQREDFGIGWAEKGFGYYYPSTYDRMQASALRIADEVRSTIASFRSDGWGVAGYGAAAKGMTFLNFAGIDLSYIFDDNPLKQGKFSACGAFIAPPSDLATRVDKKAAVFVIPAWNMRDEIVAKIKAARPGGHDRFLTWFPAVRVTE